MCAPSWLQLRFARLVIWCLEVSRGQGVSSRRLQLMDPSIKRDLILPALSLSFFLSAWLRQSEVRREFLVAESAGQTAWLPKLLSVMGPVFESGSALLIDQSKGNKAADLQWRKHKANRICFISCQIHRSLRPLGSTSAQLIMNISNSQLLWELLTLCINKHAENQFLLL